LAGDVGHAVNFSPRRPEVGSAYVLFLSMAPLHHLESSIQPGIPVVREPFEAQSWRWSLRWSVWRAVPRGRPRGSAPTSPTRDDGTSRDRYQSGAWRCYATIAVWRRPRDWSLPCRVSSRVPVAVTGCPSALRRSRTRSAPTAAGPEGHGVAVIDNRDAQADALAGGSSAPERSSQPTALACSSPTRIRRG